MSCNCGSEMDYENCCGRSHCNHALVASAESLMRSRYCAYTLQLVDYLVETTLPAERKNYSKIDILNWSVSNQWMGLKIISYTENTVEFKAYYLDQMLNKVVHHEKSTFKKLNDKWYYVCGKFYG